MSSRDGARAAPDPSRADVKEEKIESDLDDLLSNRERLNQGLELMIDSLALAWGVHIERGGVKGTASAEPAAADELPASQLLARIAEATAVRPVALQLRLLLTVIEVAAEKHSTLTSTFPAELLRFLGRR